MTDTVSSIVSIPHVVKGVLVDRPAVEYLGADGSGFATPELDLNQLVWPRTEPLPPSEVPVAEIIDLLVATGERLRDDADGFLADALEALVRSSPYERRI